MLQVSVFCLAANEIEAESSGWNSDPNTQVYTMDMILPFISSSYTHALVALPNVERRHNYCVLHAANFVCHQLFGSLVFIVNKDPLHDLVCEKLNEKKATRHLARSRAYTRMRQQRAACSRGRVFCFMLSRQYHIQTDQGPERFFRFQTSTGWVFFSFLSLHLPPHIDETLATAWMKPTKSKDSRHWPNNIMACMWLLLLHATTRVISRSTLRKSMLSYSVYPMSQYTRCVLLTNWWWFCSRSCLESTKTHTNMVCVFVVKSLPMVEFLNARTHIIEHVCERNHAFVGNWSRSMMMMIKESVFSVGRTIPEREETCRWNGDRYVFQERKSARGGKVKKVFRWWKQVSCFDAGRDRRMARPFGLFANKGLHRRRPRLSNPQVSFCESFLRAFAPTTYCQPRNNYYIHAVKPCTFVGDAPLLSLFSFILSFFFSRCCCARAVKCRPKPPSLFRERECMYMYTHWIYTIEPHPRARAGGFIPRLWKRGKLSFA